MSIIIDDNCEENKIIEISPSGRFKRFNGILGEGSSKTVYKGIDLTNNTPPLSGDLICSPGK